MGLSLVSLGIRQNAARLYGEIKSVSLLRRVQVIAMNKEHSEIILSAGHLDQMNVLRNKDGISQDDWALRKDIVLAQTEQNSLVSAPHGTYRVDIGYSSSFVCDPAKLVGVLGATNIQTIYTESRWDVTKSWISKAWSFTVSHSRRYAQRFTQILTQVSRKVPWKRYFRRITLPRMQLPEIPVKLKTNWRLALQAWRDSSAYIRRALYYKTHPKKYKIEGPGSVLLKA